MNATGRQPQEIVADLNKVLGGNGAQANPQRVRQSLQSVIDGLDAVGVRREGTGDLFDQDLRQESRLPPTDRPPGSASKRAATLDLTVRKATGDVGQQIISRKIA